MSIEVTVRDTETGDTETAVIERCASLLGELYEPAGVLMFWSARIKYLDDARPCDLYRDGDRLRLTVLADRLNAICDGAIL